MDSSEKSFVAGLSREKVCKLLGFGLSSVASDDLTACFEMFWTVLGNIDPLALRTLEQDLQMPVFHPKEGPLSFERLTGITPADVPGLKDVTFLQALCSSQTGCVMLRSLADYGQMIVDSAFPQTTQLAGLFIKVMAECARVAFHGDADSIRAAEMITEFIRKAQGINAISGVVGRSICSYANYINRSINLEKA